MSEYKIKECFTSPPNTKVEIEIWHMWAGRECIKKGTLPVVAFALIEYTDNKKTCDEIVPMFIYQGRVSCEFDISSYNTSVYPCKIICDEDNGDLYKESEGPMDDGTMWDVMDDLSNKYPGNYKELAKKIGIAEHIINEYKPK